MNISTYKRMSPFLAVLDLRVERDPNKYTDCRHFYANCACTKQGWPVRDVVIGRTLTRIRAATLRDARIAVDELFSHPAMKLILLRPMSFDEDAEFLQRVRTHRENERFISRPYYYFEGKFLLVQK